MNPKRLIAHRGDNTHYPENTLIAIEEAIKAGAVSFECDLQMNADKSLVAFHDADFIRMNGESESKIYDLSDVEMDQLSVHEPQQFGDKHRPTSVTYFTEIVELMKRYPAVQAYIEIKNDSLQFWGIETVMDKVIESLNGFEDQAVVISFNSSALEYLKTKSRLRIGFVFEEYSNHVKAIASDLNPECLICYYRILPNSGLWEGDWKWMVYTINDVALMKRLLKRDDIDFIETDDIQAMLNA